MKKLARFFMILFVLIAGGIAIVYQNILALGFSLGSLYLALFPVVFGSLYWQLKRGAVFWSLLLSLASVFVLFFGNYLNPQTALISLPVALISLIFFQLVFRKLAPVE